MKNKKGLVIGITIAIIIFIIAIIVFLVNDNIRKNEEKRKAEELNSVRQNTLEFLENAYSVTENSISTTNSTSNNNSENENKSGENTTATKQSETGTAGSRLSYADNDKQKKIDVKAAVEKKLKETYGDDLEEITINNIKLYNAEKVNSIQTLADRNLEENEVVFEVRYDLKFKDNIDINQYLAGNGEREGNSIKNKFNCGIVKVNGDNDFEMELWGTGF